MDRSVSLPALLIQVLDHDGNHKRLIELPDPRVDFIAIFNDERDDCRAVPATSKRLLVAIKNAAGEVVRTVDLPDPRTRFCEKFNELEPEFHAEPIESGAALTKGGAQ